MFVDKPLVDRSFNVTLTSLQRNPEAASLKCTAPHHTAPYRTAIHYNAPHHIATQCTAMHRTIPHRNAPNRSFLGSTKEREKFT